MLNDKLLHILNPAKNVWYCNSINSFTRLRGTPKSLDMSCQQNDLRYRNLFISHDLIELLLKGVHLLSYIYQASELTWQAILLYFESYNS